MQETVNGHEQKQRIQTEFRKFLDTQVSLKRKQDNFDQSLNKSQDQQMLNSSLHQTSTAIQKVREKSVRQNQEYKNFLLQQIRAKKQKVLTQIMKEVTSKPNPQIPKKYGYFLTIAPPPRNPALDHSNPDSDFKRQMTAR